jgi:hypothetical protein
VARPLLDFSDGYPPGWFPGPGKSVPFPALIARTGGFVAAPKSKRVGAGSFGASAITPYDPESAEEKV